MMNSKLTWSCVEQRSASCIDDFDGIGAVLSRSSMTRSIGILPLRQLMYLWQKLSHSSCTCSHPHAYTHRDITHDEHPSQVHNVHWTVTHCVRLKTRIWFEMIWSEQTVKSKPSYYELRICLYFSLIQIHQLSLCQFAIHINTANHNTVRLGS